MTGEFVLRHARFRRSGHWDDDDYDVMSTGRVVGRIFKPKAGAPANAPWQWAINDPTILPQVGFAETREQAKRAFAAAWRKAWELLP